jgi:two-component system, sensor histidine kinase LadS
MSFRFKFCFLLVLWAAVGISPLHAANPTPLPTVHISALLDAPADAQLQDVIGRPFKPVGLPFYRGYTPAVTWFRIEAPASVNAAAVIQIQPQQLDDLRFFQQDANGRWQKSQGGDRTAFAVRERGGLYTSFNWHLSDKQATVAYLRLQTSNAHAIDFQLVSPEEANAWDSSLQLAMGLFCGILLAIAFASAVRWVISRDALWGSGAVFTLHVLLQLLCLMGFSARYLWPDSPMTADQATNLMSISSKFFASLFHVFVFARYCRTRLVNWLIYSSPALSAVIFILALLKQPRLALELNNLSLFLSLFIGFVAVWFIRSEDKLLRYSVRSFFLLSTLAATLYAAPFMGLAPLHHYNMYPAFVAIALVVLTQYLIALRADTVRQREAEQIRENMQQVQSQLAHEERQHAHTLHFMSMLLHELKNPLAAIRLAGQSLQRLMEPSEGVNKRLENIDRAVQNIDHVLERSRDMDRFEQSARTKHRQTTDLHTLVLGWVEASGQTQRVRAQMPPSTCAVQVDVMVLNLMVNNLLDNALKYSPEDALVDLTVTLSTLDDKPALHTPALLIRVSNPVGRAGRPDPARLFSKYYRADAAQFISGTGLGLSWVHGVAQQAQGLVRYLPEEEHIVFELLMPC